MSDSIALHTLVVQRGSRVATPVEEISPISIEDLNKNSVTKSDRYVTLVALCILLVGPYFCYDLPASSPFALQAHFQWTDSQMIQQSNILYSLYALPNMILPWFAGYAITLYGTKRILLVLTSLVLLGQGLQSFCLLLPPNLFIYVVFLIGRILFAAGSESISIVQTQCLIQWCEYSSSPYLAFALDMATSTSRCGTVLNDIVSPAVARSFQVVGVYWVGFIMCVLTCGVGTFLVLKPSSHFAHIHAIHPVNPSAGIKETWSRIKQFPLAFHCLSLLLVLFYGSLVPFNALASKLYASLQNIADPSLVRPLLSLPDTLCIVLAPPLGFLQDLRPQWRAWYLCFAACQCTVFFLHLFAETHLDTMRLIASLINLGIIYILILGIWPCISRVMLPKDQPIAVGLATAIQNASLVLMPLLANLVVEQGDEKSALMLWAGFSFVAMLVTLVLVTAMKRVQIERQHELLQSQEQITSPSSDE